MTHQFIPVATWLATSLILLAANSVQAQREGISILVDQASGTDLNQDGTPEINQLSIVSDWSAESVKADDKLLYVLVEDRLLENAANAGDQQLESALATYSQSLAQ